MPKYQLLSATINIAGNRDHTIERGFDNDALTLPELHVLRAIHGGSEHVHSEVSVGEVARDAAVERTRLVEKYGTAVVDAVFPGLSPLPEWDDAFPTKEEHDAALRAAADAMQAAREGRRKKSPADPAPKTEATPVLPDLTAKK